MDKIITRIKKYFRKTSRWKIASDIFFWVFIILLLIPATRKPISATLIRLTMRKPHIENSTSLKSLQPEDLRLAFEDLEGYSYLLEDFNGEVTLLNFWATWCPPCRAEMPSIQKLYDHYGDKIAIILISSEKREVVEEYLTEKSFDLPVYFQKTALTPSFPVSSIPTTYIIDRKGNIVLEKKGAANWSSEEFRNQLDEMIRQ